MSPASGIQKVLIITYYWPPSGGPGVQRWLKFVQALPHCGIEPIVVTVKPNRASYPLIDQSLTGEVPKETRIIKTDTFEPLRFYTKLVPGSKLPNPGFSDQGKITFLQKIARFIRGNFFIPDARVGWNRHAYKECMRIIKTGHIDVIVTTSPPHSSHLIGLKLKKKTGIPWIADLRDPWTDIYYINNLFRLTPIQKRDAALERAVIEQASAITTVSKSLKELFIKKSDKISPDKIFLIPNGFDKNDFAGNTTIKSLHFNITYTGTMSDEYPIASFIGAVEYLLEKEPDCVPEIIFVGQLTNKIIKQLNESKLSKFVKLTGYLNHHESIRYMQQASVLLLIIPDVINNEGIATGKIYEYLASRKPILGFGPSRGDAAEIINDCQGGFVFDYKQTEKAGAWLYNLYAQWQGDSLLRTGNSLIDNYSRSEIAGKLADIVKKLNP